MSAVAEHHEFKYEYLFIPEADSEEDPIIKIWCSCGDVEEIINDLDWLPSVPSRHFLHHDVWPFDQLKNSKKKDETE